MSGIIIGADFVPTISNKNLFIDGDCQQLFGSHLIEVLKQADYRIFNLEVPLTNDKNPILKQGPNLIAPEACVNGYKTIGVNLLTLANNHILDQGVEGLRRTMEVLDTNGISWVGAGKNVSEAAAPFFFEFCGKRIGVYACAEHEFSIATSSVPGANPFDSLETTDHMSIIKKDCDFLIVLYHGGKELYQYPSPQLQKRCRKLVEKGADIVICQHSHCIGSKEEYLTGTIIYGQGNFLFDNSNNELWKTGLLVRIDEDLSISYIPIVKKGNTVRLAETEEKEIILNAFFQRSDAILQEHFIEDEYNRLADKALDNYLLSFAGKESILFRAVNRLTNGRLRKWSMGRRYGIRQKIRIQNYIECEAHNELFLRGLKK